MTLRIMAISITINNKIRTQNVITPNTVMDSVVNMSFIYVYMFIVSPLSSV